MIYQKNYQMAWHSCNNMLQMLENLLQRNGLMVLVI